MQAQVTIGTGESTATRDRGSCLTAGCPCKDPRIVSSRLAAYFAAMARRSGETADRIVAVEPGWRIPLLSLSDLELPSAGRIQRAAVLSAVDLHGSAFA